MASISQWALLLCASIASAARLTVSIPPSPPLLSNPATLPPSTHAVLLGPPGVRYDVPIRRDSTFVFPDITEASYLLTLHSRDYVFPPLRVDVSKATDASPEQSIQAWQSFRGNEWDNKGPHYGSGKGELQLQIQPSAHKNFYQERGGFNIIGFVKSPMILMALVSAVMIFGLPYLMDNSTLGNTASVILCSTQTDLLQWTRTLRRSLRRCRSRVLSPAPVAQRIKYKTSTSRAGWLARAQALVAVQLAVVAVRSDEYSVQ